MKQQFNSTMCRLLSCLSLAFGLILAQLFSPRANAEPYVPVDGVLQDRALLFQLEKGTRRVRMQIRNPETAQWDTFSIAHLRGDEMFFKVRIPDDVDAGDCRIHTSMSDPFPFSSYDGSTTYSELEGASSPTSLPSGGALYELDSSASFSAVNMARADIAATGLNSGSFTTPSTPDLVVESDIWKWRDRTLYFFNQLRGLQVIDASDPARPRKTATLRMPASGDQMYVLDDEHILLLTGKWSYHWAWGSSRNSEVILVRHRGDELTVLNRYPLEGNFMESRLVGRRLYTVSRVYREVELEDESYAWRNTLEVRSLDLTDPDNPTSLEPLTLSSETQSYYWDAVVTATPNYFLIAPSYYDSEGLSTRSRVLTIPIGASVSELKATHEIDAQARVADKFKLHERDDVLFVVSQESRRWNQTLSTSIESFDLSQPEITTPTGTLEIAPRERLHATRFDGDRLYIVTFLVPARIDPLFVIDVSDPADMAVQGELVVPGWANYLEPISNDRLLAVGLENGNVAVSLYDVEDPAQPTQLGRVFPGEGSTNTEANFDEKAFNYLAEEGLAMLPVESRGADGSRESRMHLLDVTSSALVERGSILHEIKGRRATAFGDTVLSISENKLLSVDISDRDEPQIKTALSLAWGVERIVEVEEFSIHIQSGFRNPSNLSRWSVYQLQNSIGRIHVTPSSDPDTAIASLELPEGEVVGSIVSGSTLFLASLLQVEEELLDQDGRTQSIWVTKMRTTAVDLSELEHPRIADTDDFVLTQGYSHRYSELTGAMLPSGTLLWYPNVESNNHSAGWGWNHWGYSSFPSLSVDFLGSARYLGPIYSFVSEMEMIAYEVDDPSDLSFLSRTLVRPDNLSRIGKAFLHGDKLMLSYKGSTYDGLRHSNRYFVQEVGFAQPEEPVVSTPVNVPGSLEGTFEIGDGQLLLFTTTPKFRGNTQWSFQTSNALLQASIYDGSSAFLANEISIEDGRYTPTVVSGQFVIKSYWDFDFQGLKLFAWSPDDGTFSDAAQIDLGHVPEALHLHGGILFAQSAGKISAIPLESLLEPEAHLTTDWPAYRYATWLHRLRVSPDRKTAWIPAGNYGVETIDLSPLGLGAIEVNNPNLAQANWSDVPVLQASMVTASGSDAADPLTSEVPYSVGTPLSMRLDQWRLAHFNPTGDPDIPLPAIRGDSDLDGIIDLQEFLFASNPLNPASLPAAPSVGEMDGSLAITYLLSAAALDDVQISLQSSVDLKKWAVLPEELVSAIW
ncbi:MAG: beta-propeller domain-containing protein, partial [Verrucomicrobiales bacterium]